MDLQNENSESESPQQTPQEYLATRQEGIRKNSRWAIGIGGFLVIVHVGWLVLFWLIGLKADFSILFRSIIFILGFFALIGGIWGLYYAKNLTLDDVIPTPEAIQYLQQSRKITPYYTYILVIAVVAVYIVQVMIDAENPKPDELAQSVQLAGLVKPAVWQGEFWRLLTVGTLHGGFLHIYFNGQALYGLGTTVEYLSNRAHLAIVFVLAIIVGAVFSLYFMPDTTSVGASGGIMGIIGYAAILGYRRKQQMPPDFLRSMLINIGFIVAFGLVAYQIVDNFGHLGGLAVGVIYGFLQIPKSLDKDPRKVGAVADFLGMIAMGVYVFTAIFSILLILQKIKF